jgi:hypothetical protein
MKLTTATLLWVGLSACGGGHPSRSVDGSVDTTVDAPPSGGTTLTIHTYRTSGPVNLPLVAVQDGEGAWTALDGTAGVYMATLQSDHYAVMTTCVFESGSSVTINYATISDATTLYLPDCADPGAAFTTISGAIAGAAAGNSVRVLDDLFDYTDVPAGTTTYALATEVGPERLFAEELVDLRPVKLAPLDATVTDNATVNFDLAAGFAPVTHALSASTGIATASLSYRDVHGFSKIDRVQAPYDTFRAIPADKLDGGLNRLLVADTNGNYVVRYFKDPIDEHVTMPTQLQLAQQPTATATPYPNVRFVVPVQADTLYDLGFSTTDATNTLSQGFRAEMTSAFIAKAFPGATSFAYTAPDLRGVAGWKTDYQPRAGLPLGGSGDATKNVNIDWAVAVPPGTLFDHDGSEFQTTSVYDTLPAP